MPFSECQLVVGEVGERDLGCGTLDADGADKQPHQVLLPGRGMFDAGADFRIGGVGPGGTLGHRLAAQLLAVAAADSALAFEPRRIGNLAFADEAEGAADRDAALVAKARDGDVDPGLPLANGFALATFKVQRASVSFCAARAG